MRVHVSTFLNASPTTVWSTVKRKELLHYVIAPMGKFSPFDGITRGAWIPGTAYDGRSFMFSIIPVGTRTILIESVDDRSMTIQSREHGEIGLKRWDHLIAVKPEGDGSRYSDTSWNSFRQAPLPANSLKSGSYLQTTLWSQLSRRGTIMR